MDHEAGGEHAPPPSGPTGATTDALGAHAAPGSAASGMAQKVGVAVHFQVSVQVKLLECMLQQWALRAEAPCRW